ncbi:hypothetical protein JZU61_00435 [bacterium]|nr:hypothetical protein [bacterium]
MRKYIYFFLISLLLLNACSTGQKSLDQGNYYDAIMKAASRLSSDPENRKASQVISEGYPMAVIYYQEEIDKVLTGNDPFKWRRTLEIMQTVNQMSDEIRRIPAARKLVPSPKNYTSEMTNVQNRAAQEFYDAGMDALSRKTRETAKQAYFHFLNADGLVRGYKDTQQKMLMSKDLATVKVVVEQIPVNGKFEYSAQFFYDNVLQMGFYDFFIDRPQHSEEQQELSTQVEEKYQVKISKDSTVTRIRMIPKKGKIKILTDQVASGGLLELKAVEFQSQKIVFTDKIPGQYMWQNKYGIFVGDNEVLDKEHINILNNKMIMPPPAQDMFVLFTKPIFNQLADKLTNYFRQYN